MKYITKIITILVLIPFLFSCNDDNPVVSSKSKHFSLLSGGNISNVSSLMETYLYDQDLVGIIEFTSTKRNDLSWNYFPGDVKVLSEYNGIINEAYAGFRDQSDQPFSLENIVINARLLREYSKGAYSDVGPDNFSLYFDGSTSNKYYLECLNNSLIPDSVYDQVLFSNRIEITNVQRYDTVHASQGLHLTWSGGASTGKVVVDFNINDYSEGSMDQSPGFYHLVENTGNYTIDPVYFQFAGPRNKYFDIEIRSYEPIIRTLSNGKKIILLGISKYKTTVFFTD